MGKLNQGLTLITEVLVASNVAIPIIFSLITTISAMVKGITGKGLTLIEIADLIQTQLATNDTYGRAEIARLKTFLGAS